ncbi:MAG: hypothetical protein OHK0039_02920 [Bacteroidia bacterium]
MVLLCGAGLACLGQRPFVSGTFPRNGATAIACDLFIKATISFPAEGRQIDPATLHAHTVRLYPSLHADQQVPASMQYDEALRTLTLRPAQVLRPRTRYTFEVTADLIDERGFACMPFRMEIMTSDCDQAIPVSEGPTADAESGFIAPEPVSVWGGMSAAWVQDSLRIQWYMLREVLNQGFRIDWTTDTAAPFRTIAYVASPGDTDSLRAYSWTDTEPQWGWNWYQITYRDLYDSLYIADTLRAFRAKIAWENLTLETGDSLHILLVLEKPTTMAFVLKKPNGEILRRKAGLLPAGTSSYPIPLGRLAPGVYQVYFRTEHTTLSDRLRIVAKRP